MRTIAIINQKGGCGKTTVAVNLAAVLAAIGRRTLLVDMDPQSHCALGLAVPETQIERSIGDVLRAGLDGSLGLADILWQITRNLDLAPSGMALAGLEQELTAAPDKDRRLAQVLSTVSERYEFCIVDCPPAIGLLTFNALRAAEEIFIPVETGYFSMQGAFRQQATIEMMARRANHRARLSVLATMYDVRTKVAREILAELRNHFGDSLLPVVVHFNSKLKEAASFGQAINEYDPGSTGYQDFEQLARWLIDNPPESANQPVVAASPALSRAAELAERARALSARTVSLSASLARDPDLIAEPALARVTAPAPPVAPLTSGGGGGNGHGAVASPVAPVLVRETTATPGNSGGPANLAEKLARLYGVRPTAQGLLFLQPVNGNANLAIAGDFNNWSSTANPMRRDEMLGIWQALIPVPPGRYRYRLVVDGQWIQDPYNKTVETNPFGELNNVAEIRREG